ncbi:MAG: IS200/IS605 family transposase [Anaerolineales bacterium]
MKRNSTFYQLVYHFTWGTKNHLPLLTLTVEDRLFPYIGYKCKELGYFLHAINGTEDHVHLLLSLTPSILVEDVAKNLKGASSHYINKESNLGEVLYWQNGYGVVTLRETEILKVVKYINHQKEHHLNGDLSEVLERWGE